MPLHHKILILAVLLGLVACGSGLAAGQRVIGKWTNDDGTMQITIVLEGQTFFRIQVVDDAEPQRYELIEISRKATEKRRFADKGRRYETAYVIDTNGNLDVYGRAGFEVEFKKVD